jgi:hypothetical protein
MSKVRGRLATNQGVVGSIPAGRASLIKGLGEQPNPFFFYIWSFFEMAPTMAPTISLTRPEQSI